MWKSLKRAWAARTVGEKKIFWRFEHTNYNFCLRFFKIVEFIASRPGLGSLIGWKLKSNNREHFAMFLLQIFRVIAERSAFVYIVKHLMNYTEIVKCEKRKCEFFGWRAEKMCKNTKARLELCSCQTHAGIAIKRWGKSGKCTRCRWWEMLNAICHRLNEQLQRFTCDSFIKLIQH